MRARIGSDPKYGDRSEEAKDKITAGIWHGYPDETKERLAAREGKSVLQMSEKRYAYLLSKDFGGWTSQNSDWERGYREGERKQEDRQRGIENQRSREPQFNKKEVKPIYATDADNEVRKEQKKERQDSLRYRAGEMKEQHQGVGKVTVTPGKPTKPVAKPLPTTAKYFKTERYGLFIPIETRMATKSVGEISKGDLLVEGFISAPVKDLQGDVLEEPALIKAKNTIVKDGQNLVWLDHESPYANPEANQATPPIGKFVDAKIVKNKGIPSLWVRMLVNKAHPLFEKVAYELKNGFYKSFSMEFIPLRAIPKVIGGKLANAIGDIKYFATSLVRAPACEMANITKVYQKAFANSSRFYPVQVKWPEGTGQIVKEKGENTMSIVKEAEPEYEPEAEPEDEPEDEPTASMEGPTPQEMQRPFYSQKEYDRQTGGTAAERLSTAMGEWGDPALEKGRAVMKDHADRISRLESYAEKSFKLLKAVARGTALMGKQYGIEIKGIDESTMESLDPQGASGSSGLDEQAPPDVRTGPQKPKTQRIIEGLDLPEDQGVASVDDQEVGSKSARYIADLVRKTVAKEISKKIVVRKGFNEYAGPQSESMRKAQAMEKDDGSIDSQLAIIG